MLRDPFEIGVIFMGRWEIWQAYLGWFVLNLSNNEMSIQMQVLLCLFQDL